MTQNACKDTRLYIEVILATIRSEVFTTITYRFRIKEKIYNDMSLRRISKPSDRVTCCKSKEIDTTIKNLEQAIKPNYAPSKPAPNTNSINCSTLKPFPSISASNMSLPPSHFRCSAHDKLARLVVNHHNRDVHTFTAQPRARNALPRLTCLLKTA